MTDVEVYWQVERYLPEQGVWYQAMRYANRAEAVELLEGMLRTARPGWRFRLVQCTVEIECEEIAP